MNLTDGSTFTTPLIKCAITRGNKKIKSTGDTTRRIRDIAINNGWNTQIFQILCDIRDGKILSRPPKPVKITQKCIKKILKYQEPEF